MYPWEERERKANPLKAWWTYDVYYPLYRLAKRPGHYYYKTKRFFQNVWLFKSALTHYESFDWTGTADFMQIGFREISKHHSRDKLVADYKKVAKRTLVASELCKRMIDDEYSYMHGYKDYKEMTDSQRRNWALRSRYSMKNDQQYLGHLIGKYMYSWWD